MLGRLSPAQIRANVLSSCRNRCHGNKELEELYWTFGWMGTTLQTVTADALHVAARYMKDSLRTHLRMAEYHHMHTWLEAILDRDQAIRERDMAACASGHADAEQLLLFNEQVTEATSVAESSIDIDGDLLSSMTFDRITYAFWRFDNEDSTPPSSAGEIHSCDSKDSEVPSRKSKSDIVQATAVLSEPASSVPSVHSRLPEGDTYIPSESGSKPPKTISADEACKEIRKLFKASFQAELKEPVDDQKLDLLLETWSAVHIYITARDYWDRPFSRYRWAVKAARFLEKAVQKQHPILQEFVPILGYTVQSVNIHIDSAIRAAEVVNARTITPVDKLKFRLRGADKKA